MPIEDVRSKHLRIVGWYLTAVCVLICIGALAVLVKTLGAW